MSQGQAGIDPVASFMGMQKLDPETDVTCVFHAVRKIPYFSNGNRDIETVVKENRGSCSGKHILLRDTLRRLGHCADIETVKGDFTSRIPVLTGMHDELRWMCENEEVVDFHQYVVWDSPRGEVMLDTTWSDGPIAHGMPGNQHWAGDGHTALALTPHTVMGRVEYIHAYKEKLLAALDPGTRQRRKTFLSLLADWAAKTETERG